MFPGLAGVILGINDYGAWGATVAVYDVTGRLIRTVVDRAMPPGAHDAAWDARDESGVKVSAGLYFVRLRTGGESYTQKVVVSR